MSLEEQIVSLNENIVTLTNVIRESLNNNEVKPVELKPVEEAAPPAPPRKKRGRPRKTPLPEPKVEAQEEEQEEEEKFNGSGTDSDEEELSVLRSKFKELINASEKGRDDAIAILGKRKCTRVPELDPSDYSAVILEIDEILNENFL